MMRVTAVFVGRPVLWGLAYSGEHEVLTLIKRSEFGMTWNTVLEAGGVLVGDDISIHVDVELLRKK
jgi:hypothetical protein